jgi:hypothetical protein
MGRVLLRRGGNSTMSPTVPLFLLLFILVLFILVDCGYRVRRFTVAIRQRAQFASFETALELFASEFGGYPPSEANDAAGLPYGGAMKLAEAMVGRDLRGFHLSSVFRADGLDPNTHLPLYPNDAPSADNLKARRGPFLMAQSTNAFRLVDIYGKGRTGPFPEDTLVLCDVYERKRPGGKKTGMPILYYRANPGGTAHDVNNPDNPQNIYSYKDNDALVRLGVPGDSRVVHPLMDPKRFYLDCRSDKPTISSRPVRNNSFILISAGRDGLYGTPDDICNFEWKYRER